MDNAIVVQQVENGFFVRPECHQPHSEPNGNDCYVFESYANMFAYIENKFGPLGITVKNTPKQGSRKVQ